MATEKKMDQVILGLLSHEPMTGYQIKKRIDSTLHFFWSASFGSIYPTLNKLEKDGLVTKEESQENNRKKVTYSITENGRDKLKEWLRAPIVKDELRYETLLKLFFSEELGREGAIQHIQNFEDNIKSELPILELCVDQLSKIQDNEAHKYYLATALFGLETYNSYLRWCKRAKELLKE